MTIYEIIESIAAIGSTKAKQAIVEANKDNEVLRLAFLYTENPRYNYFVTANVSNAPPGRNDLTRATFYELDRLISREFTGNAAREFIKNLQAPLTANARAILIRIINKDLRCNCGTAISNKVWKGLIPEYPVMLASKGDTKGFKYLAQFENKCGFFVQRKCDGGRCIVKVDAAGNVTYHSRNGNELDLFGQFDAVFCKFPGQVFDGELLVTTKNGVADRKTGNGFYTKAVRGTLSAAEASRFSIVIWDITPEAEFYAGQGTVIYSIRLAFLKKNFSATGDVSVVESKKVNTLEECNEVYTEMRSRGEEGTIIKVADGMWEDKRSKNCVKVKAEETADLLCIGTEKGSGKNANRIGNLICETSCGKLLVGVGTGLTDADRDRDPKDYIGQVIEVGYNEVISSKDSKKATKSLFLPVYKQIRFDKNVANSLEELK